MKKSFSVAGLILFSLINGSFGETFMALGECEYENHSDWVCVPGGLKFHHSSTGGYCCYSDCALFEDEAFLKGTDWKVWGGVPFGLISRPRAGYIQGICVRQSCLDEAMGCQIGTAYACDQGFYGKSTNGTTGCTQCPDNGMTNLWGIGGFVITDCYLPANSERSDSSGTYKVTADCKYSL